MKYISLLSGKIKMVFLSVVIYTIPFIAYGQEHNETSLIHQSETFWASLDFSLLKEEIGVALHLSANERDLFYQYLQPLMHEDKLYFFSQAPYGGLLPEQYQTFFSRRKTSYIAQYPKFLNDRKLFLQSLAQSAASQTLSVNAPCTNIGFEDGTLSGWTTETGNACGGTNCTLPTTNNPACHIKVTTKSMTDPFIPILSPVDPAGGNYSVRLENYQNGGDQSRISQTFLVTAANNIFTYKYAVVLEDPTGGHTDNQRPFFDVQMYDQNGNEISCASYTRIAAPQYLPDYINYPVSNPAASTSSDNCPYGGNNPSKADNTRNFWYKNWTTVSIPLQNYVGQTVTIQFTASDCSLGAHLGYAYIDAQCGSIIPLVPLTICGAHTLTYTTETGFASYQWSGGPAGGIVGATNTPTVTFAKAGVYTLTLVPISDNAVNCPTSINITVYEHCPPPPFSTGLCEDTSGTGRATGINLNTYNTQITNYNTSSPKAVVSWHSAYPPVATNKVGTPASPTHVTATNGSKYYAIVQYTNNPGADTVELDFTIYPRPHIGFSAIPSSCQGTSSFQLNATPVGGSYSGTHVTASGLFDPSIAGSYTIQYKYTNAQGCADSATQVAVVIAPPAVNAGTDQSLCANVSSITLSGTATHYSSITWSGGAGTFNTSNSLSSTYTPTVTEKTAGSITLTLTAAANAPCNNATDQMVIHFEQVPVMHAGPDQTQCETNPVFALNGNASNGGQWSGGNGSFSPNATAGNSSYTANATDIAAGIVTLTYTSTGNILCPTVSDQMVLTLIASPAVNAGTDQSLCANVSSITLSGTATHYSSVTWSGGAGTFNTSNSLSSTYTPTVTEKTAGSITLTLTAAANAPCNNATDQMVIHFEQVSVMHAGPDQTQCETNPVFALNGNASNGGQWSGGNGSFSPNATAGNSSYTANATDIAAGIVTLTYTSTGNILCPTVSDQVVLTLIASPAVNAGTDQSLCANVSSITLSGTATHYSSVTWSGGAGTFNTSNSLSSTYTPTVTEKTAGSITLTLTAAANAPCNNATDQMVIHFEQVSVMHAGPDQTQCETNPVFALNGNASNGGQWSGGNGNFSPNATAGNSSYTANATDIAAGIVTLTYTSTGNILCPTVSDQMVLTLIASPAVNAGTDQSLCANVSSITLSGTATHYSSVTWSGGAGTFNTSNSLSSTYTPTVTEKTAGSITLTLTAAANAPCNNATDQMVIHFEQVPVMHAGPDQTQCETNPVFALNGNASNGGQWSGGNGSFSPNATAGNSSYTANATDIAAGIVTLTYTSTGNILCPTVSDQVVLTLIASPAVNAGTDQHQCTTITTISLNATAGNFSSVNWSGGAGVFSNNNALSTTYTPTGNEKTAGSILLTLTANANAPCSNASDQLILYFEQNATVDAGPDQIKCSNDYLIFNLHALASNATGGSWSSRGTGFFSSNGIDASYTASTADIREGAVELLFTTSGNTYCPSASDSLMIRAANIPTPHAGPNQTVCLGSLLTSSVPAQPGETYVWENRQGITMSNTNTVSLNISTDTILVIKATNALNCSNTDTLRVTMVPFPLLSLLDTAMCPGQHVTLDGVLLNASALSSYTVSYQWKKDAILVIGDAAQLTVNTAGVYTIVATAHGNCTSSENAAVVIHPVPVVDMAKEIIYCEDDSTAVTLDAGAGYHYVWTPSKEITQSIAVSSPGIYSVTVTNDFGCFARGQTLVRQVCKPRLFVSNAFSPDNDQINDWYTVYGAHIVQFHMLIFSRWGEIIFESKDRTNAWNGIYLDQPMPIGVYPWVITYEGDTEEYKGPYKLEGSVTIVR